MKKFYTITLSLLVVGITLMLLSKQTFYAQQENVITRSKLFAPVNASLLDQRPPQDFNNITAPLPYSKTTINTALKEYFALAFNSDLASLTPTSSKIINDIIAISGAAPNQTQAMPFSNSQTIFTDSLGEVVDKPNLASSLTITSPTDAFKFDSDLPASYQTSLLLYYTKLQNIFGLRNSNKQIIVNYTPSTSSGYTTFNDYLNTIFITGTYPSYQEDVVWYLAQAYVNSDRWNSQFRNILSSTASAILFKENNLGANFLSNFDYFSPNIELMDAAFSAADSNYRYNIGQYYDFQSIILMYKLRLENKYILSDIYHKMSYTDYSALSNAIVFEDILSDSIPKVENQVFSQWLSEYNWFIDSDTKSKEIWIEPSLTTGNPYITESTNYYHLNYRSNATAKTVLIEAYNATNEKIGSVVKTLSPKPSSYSSNDWQSIEIISSELFGANLDTFKNYTGLVKFVLSPDSSGSNKKNQYFPKINTVSYSTVNLVGMIIGAGAEVDITDVATSQTTTATVINNIFLTTNSAHLAEGRFLASVYSADHASLLGSRYINKVLGKYTAKVYTAQNSCLVSAPSISPQPKGVKINITNSKSCQYNLFINSTLVAKTWEANKQFTMSNLIRNTKYTYAIGYTLFDGTPKTLSGTFTTLNLADFTVTSAKIYANSSRSSYNIRVTLNRQYKSTSLSNIKLYSYGCSSTIDLGRTYKSIAISAKIVPKSSTVFDIVPSSLPCFNTSVSISGLTKVTDLYGQVAGDYYYYDYVNIPYHPKTTVIPRITNPTQNMKINSSYKFSINFKPLHPSLLKSNLTFYRQHYPYSCYLKYKKTYNYTSKCGPVSTTTAIKGSSVSVKGKNKLEYHNYYSIGTKPTKSSGYSSWDVKLMDSRKNIVDMYFNGFVTYPYKGKKPPYIKSYKTYKNSSGSVTKIAIIFNNKIKDNYQYATIYATGTSYSYPTNLKMKKSNYTLYLYPKTAIPKNSRLYVYIDGVRDKYNQYATNDSRYDLPVELEIPNP